MRGRSKDFRGRRTRDPYADRLARYRDALDKLGMGPAFAELPEPFQLFLCKRKSPDPAIVFDESFPTGRAMHALRREIERRFLEAEFEIEGRTINWREYHAVVGALGESIAMEPLLTRRTPEFTRFCDAIRPRMQQVLEQCSRPSSVAVYKAVNEPLARHTRLSQRLLVSRIDQRTNERGKWETRVTVGAEPPKVRDETIDGKRRPVYRVAWTFGGVKWTSWKGADLGHTGEAGEQEWPVYVQSHAIEQMNDRLDDPSARAYAECWLVQSLQKPVIVQRRGRERLVAFELDGHRVGYLVCTPLVESGRPCPPRNDQASAAGDSRPPVGGIIVVRTFLFLTMEQTPEARKLERELKLLRADRDWLQMDRLSKFTQTDLADAPDLRAKLERCGCGQLLALREADFRPPVQSAAAELRKYLRLAA